MDWENRNGRGRTVRRFSVVVDLACLVVCLVIVLCVVANFTYYAVNRGVWRNAGPETATLGKLAE
jgi:hypothetical protein